MNEKSPRFGLGDFLIVYWFTGLPVQIDSLDGSWEGDRFANVFDATDLAFTLSTPYRNIIHICVYIGDS